MNSFQWQVRRSDKKTVGLKIQIGEAKPVFWGVNGDYNWLSEFKQPVRSIELSESFIGSYGPFRWINFYDIDNKCMASFHLFTSFWPKS